MSVVGHEVLYRENGAETRGHVLAKEHTGSMILDTNSGEEWPGIRFKIRPLDGSPDFWTVTYPDKEENR